MNETKAERNARIDDLFDQWLTELLTRLSERDEEIVRLREEHQRIRVAILQVLDRAQWVFYDERIGAAQKQDFADAVMERLRAGPDRLTATPAESKERASKQ